MKKRSLVLFLAAMLAFTSIPMPTNADEAFIAVEEADIEEDIDDGSDMDDSEFYDYSNQPVIEEIKLPEEMSDSDAAVEPEMQEDTEEDIEEDVGSDKDFALEVEEEEVGRTLQQELSEKGIVDGTIASGEEIVNPQKAAVSLPSKFDPRSAGMVSGIRDQVGGTCWLFAATAAAEISLIKKGIAPNTVDLSELATAYFLFNPHVDRLGNYSHNTGNTYKSDNLWDFMYGGCQKEAINLMSSWAVPVLESDATFTTDVQYELATGKPQNTYMTKEEVNAVVLNEALTDKNYYHLKNTRTSKYEVTKEAQDHVKNLVYTYGNVTASYYNNGGGYIVHTQGGDATYFYPHATLGMVSHAVCIIGWDDNYPKENFQRVPPGNGAFLCKNSWGEVTGNNGIESNGFFWMSYYEQELCDIVAVEMDRGDVYANMYNYDGGLGPGLRSGYNTSLNIYTAKAYGEGCVEKVDGIMTYLKDNTQYKLTLYLEPEVKDGKLIGYQGKSKTFTGSSDYEGFYTIDTSSNPLYVPNGKRYGIYMEVDKDNGIGSGAWSLLNGVSYAGKDKNSLEECIDKEKCAPTLRGLTNKAEGFVSSTDVSLSHESISILTGEKSQLTGKVAPDNVTAKGISYISSNPEVATISESGEIYGKGAGKCLIYAYAGDGNSYETCEVTVSLSAVSMKDAAVQKGSQKTLSLIYPEGINGYGNEAFLWVTSNQDVLTVDEKGTVKGKKDGKAIVTAYLATDTSVYAECEVTVFSVAESISFPAEFGVNLSEGESMAIKAEILPKEAGGNVTYTIEDPSVVTYKDGVLTGKAVGYTKIIATTTDGSNLSAELPVSVWGSITALAPSFPAGTSITLKKGDSQYVTLYADSQRHDFYNSMSVTSSNGAVVSVDKVDLCVNGGNCGFTMTAKAPGTAAVTVKANDKKGLSVTYQVTVKGEEIQQEQAAPKEVILTIKNVKYKVIGDKKLEITGTTKNKKTYTLYATVDYKGATYKVVSIGEEAFKNRKITSITLPSTLTEIKKNAFSGCSKLKSIKIPKKVTKIGSKAFYKCSKLSKVTFSGKKIKSIGSSAFKKCAKSGKFYVPSSKEKAYKKLLKGKMEKKAKVVKK